MHNKLVNMVIVVGIKPICVIFTKLCINYSGGVFYYLFNTDNDDQW